VHTAQARVRRPSPLGPLTRPTSLALGEGARAGDELRGRQVRLAADADRDRLVARELPRRHEAECAREQRVVAERRVAVQRQVRGVDGDVVIEQSLESTVDDAADRLRAGPEHPVVHEQEVGSGVDRAVYRAAREVHRRRHLLHAPRVLELQPVERAAVVGRVARREQVVEVANEVGKRKHENRVRGVGCRVCTNS
jgi:hypothetical protein